MQRILALRLVGKEEAGQEMNRRAERRRGIGLDSNVISYLITAMALGYDPSLDRHDRLTVERVAAMRVFLYLGDLFITPTASREIEAIGKPELRALHEQVRAGLLNELAVVESAAIRRRVMSLRGTHNKEADCRILSEAEFGGLSHLLTLDTRFQSRLDPVSPVALLSPSEFWRGASPTIGAQPRW